MRKNNTLVIGAIIVVILFIGLSLWFSHAWNNSPLGDFTFMNGSSTPAAATTTASTTTSSTSTKEPVDTTPRSVVITKTTTTTTNTVPVLNALEPAATSVGSTVILIGTGFSKTKNYIAFGTSGGRKHADGTADNVVTTEASSDGKTLTFVVPTTGPSGILCDAQNNCASISAKRIAPGTYPVTVSTSAGTSKAAVLTVVAQ